MNQGIPSRSFVPESYRSHTALGSAETRIAETQRENAALHTENARLKSRGRYLTVAVLFLGVGLLSLCGRLMRQDHVESHPPIVLTTVLIDPGNERLASTPCHGIGTIQYVASPNLPSWNRRFRFLPWRSYDCAERIPDEGQGGESCSAICWPKSRFEPTRPLAPPPPSD